MFADGYFPRGQSLLRQVQEERLVGLFYGQRALCIGALSPLNYVGTSEHSYAKATPFKRLVHTGNAFEKIYFGTREEADKVLSYVARMHERVNGALAEDAGPVTAGTPYSAYDPELMLWTMAVIADSGQYFYELFVRRLERREHARRCGRTTSRFAWSCSGCRARRAPQSYPEFRAWWRSELSASDRMHLTDEARYVGYATAFQIPLPRRSQPAKRGHDAIMLGSLPPRVRELYGPPYGRREQLPPCSAPASRCSALRVASRRRRSLAATTRARSNSSRRPSAAGWRTASRHRRSPLGGPGGPGIEVIQRAA